MYVLETDLNTQNIGIYPQGHCYERTESNIKIEIEGKAILTDKLNILNCDESEELVVTDKSYNLLKPYLPKSVIIKKAVIDNKSDLYWSVYFQEGLENIIDFPKCKMLLSDYSGEIGKYVVSDYNDFQDKWMKFRDGEIHGFKEMTNLYCSEIAFLKLPNIGIGKIVSDFEPFYKHSGIFVNDKIFKVIKKELLTGFEFTPLNFTIS